MGTTWNLAVAIRNSEDVHPYVVDHSLTPYRGCLSVVGYNQQRYYDLQHRDELLNYSLLYQQ